ncbi:3751_t:CDS:2 [Dentiscutata erythropus]|uniref:3751_t:CDS:1 n=1 Tax=Dentiscutata erythropus TaxID=1348616 RepID=A0A9N9CHN3_9GLOM|nr:3751_t:CDS:2 [Dentiscutata erythropus]
MQGSKNIKNKDPIIILKRHKGIQSISNRTLIKSSKQRTTTSVEKRYSSSCCEG